MDAQLKKNEHGMFTLNLQRDTKWLKDRGFLIEAISYPIADVITIWFYWIDKKPHRLPFASFKSTLSKNEKIVKVPKNMMESKIEELQTLKKTILAITNPFEIVNIVSIWYK